MKRYQIFIVVAIIAIIIAVSVFFLNKKQNRSTEQRAEQQGVGEQISTDINEESAEQRIVNILQNKNEIMQNAAEEAEISSYSTIIKDKEAGRLTNIGITCSILNDTVIHKRRNVFF